MRKGLEHRSPRAGALGLLLLAISCSSAVAAQAAIATTALRAHLQSVAGRYPIQDIEFFDRDSARIIVEDPSRTAKAVMEGRWMFGPPVTTEEADGCPPQKVLGRRIARELWRRQGKVSGLEQIIVRVRGTSGIDRLSYADLYYGRPELDGPWIGDRPAPSQRRRPRLGISQPLA